MHHLPLILIIPGRTSRSQISTSTIRVEVGEGEKREEVSHHVVPRLILNAKYAKAIVRWALGGASLFAVVLLVAALFYGCVL